MEGSFDVIRRSKVEAAVAGGQEEQRRTKNRPLYLKATLSGISPPVPCRRQGGACAVAKPPPRNVYIMLTNKWSR